MPTSSYSYYLFITAQRGVSSQILKHRVRHFLPNSKISWGLSTTRGPETLQQGIPFMVSRSMFFWGSETQNGAFKQNSRMPGWVMGTLRRDGASWSGPSKKPLLGGMGQTALPVNGEGTQEKLSHTPGLSYVSVPTSPEQSARVTFWHTCRAYQL